MPQEVTIPNTHVHRISTSRTGYDYQIEIKLPDGYELSEDRYPAIYVLDGNWYFPMIASIAHTMSVVLPDEPDIPKAIIIGIGYETKDTKLQLGLRRRDFTPSIDEEFATEKGIVIPGADIKNSFGQASEFLEFIREDVIPLIDRTYRTEPNLRIGHGHSFGALMLLYVLFNQPDTFHSYIAASTSLWWDNEIILQHEETYYKTHKDLLATVYITAGTDELETLSGATTLIKRLQSRNYPRLRLHYEFMVDETHMSVVARTFTNGLRKLLNNKN